MSLFVVVNAGQISLIALTTYGQALVARRFARFASGADAEGFVHCDLVFFLLELFGLIGIGYSQPIWAEDAGRRSVS